MSCIVVSDLTKVFPGGHDAVAGVSFEVGRGEIVSLVGPNGAGKSTTLNMLATLLKPTSGEAHVLGVSILEPEKVRRMIGVALQATGVDPLMTVEQHFQAHAALFGMNGGEAMSRGGKLLTQFSLDGVLTRRSGDLSGGTQRRLSLALALLHNPEVIILDEPTVGLDPNVRRSMWDHLLQLRSSGLTILFSTHYLEEADQLCDRILLLSKGKIVSTGSPEELKASATSGSLRLRVRGATDVVQAALAGLVASGIVKDPVFQEAGSIVELEMALKGAPIAALVDALQARGVEIADLEWTTGSLEDAFSRLSEPLQEESSARLVALEHRAHARRKRIA